MKCLILASAAFAGAVIATSAFAQTSGTCLQPNQITAASVMDDQTVIVNDRARRTFVVRLNSTCQGPTKTPWRLGFAVPTNQECVRPGDRVTFRHPSVGRNTCFVNEVSTDLVSVAAINRPFSRVN